MVQHGNSLKPAGYRRDYVTAISGLGRSEILKSVCVSWDGKGTLPSVVPQGPTTHIAAECCKAYGQPFPPAEQLQPQASFTSQFARTIPASPAAPLQFGTPSAAPGSFWGATPSRRANPTPLGTPKPSPFGSALRSGQVNRDHMPPLASRF